MIGLIIDNAPIMWYIDVEDKRYLTLKSLKKVGVSYVETRKQ